MPPLGFVGPGTDRALIVRPTTDCTPKSETLKKCVVPGNETKRRFIVTIIYESAMPRKKRVPPVRGQPIRFTKGTYAGHCGWVNSAKPQTSLSFHVIIDMDQPPSEDGDCVTTVRKDSVADRIDDPKSAEEFVIKEDPKVAYHLAMLAKSLAECGLCGTDQLLNLIKGELDNAMIVQLSKGKKAKYSETALRVARWQKEKDQHMAEAVGST
jgi:hypothetical protein